MPNRLALYILISLIAGIGFGVAIHHTQDGATIEAVGKWLELVTTIFLRLIKMIIAPLVFATLVAGVAHMGSGASLGRIATKTMFWFISASIVSLGLGMLMVNVLQPGVGLNIEVPPASATALAKPPNDIFQIITAMFPKSIFEAMANNTLLQIVVFSLFFGVGLAATGEKGKPILDGIDALVEVMLKVTGYVMRLSPIAVFAAMAHATAENGLQIIWTFSAFVGSFYLSLIVLWTLLLLACFAVVGRRTGTLIKLIREPILIAFSTASSEAAYPQTLNALTRFGVPPRIASFVLPLGYSFNLDGSMMYMTFATIFLAQLYGIDLSLAQQFSLFLTLMLTSKGMASVPRASLVVVSATILQFGIPEAGLVLILAIDQFLDMGRTGTNVVGNSVATVVIAKWEKALGEGEPDIKAEK